MKSNWEKADLLYFEGQPTFKVELRRMIDTYYIKISNKEFKNEFDITKRKEVIYTSYENANKAYQRIINLREIKNISQIK